MFESGEEKFRLSLFKNQRMLTLADVCVVVYFLLLGSFVFAIMSRTVRMERIRPGITLTTNFIERNQRASAPLSPNFSLFLTPSGTLYLKVQHLLAVDELFQRSHPPLIKHRRHGMNHPKYGIPTELWQAVVHRVVGQQEPLHIVAVAYRVSYKTIRRIRHHVQKQCRQEYA